MAAADGVKQEQLLRLDAPPIFEGMIAAQGRLFVSTTDGKLVCLGK